MRVSYLLCKYKIIFVSYLNQVPDVGRLTQPRAGGMSSEKNSAEGKI